MQVNFSEQSIREINRLDPLEQVEIIGNLGELRPEQFQNSHDTQRLGKIHRNGKTFYRIRLGDLRFYFEFQKEGIFCHYILPKHSFEDLKFRLKLPLSESEIEENNQFWEFLENSDNKKD